MKQLLQEARMMQEQEQKILGMLESSVEPNLDELIRFLHFDSQLNK